MGEGYVFTGVCLFTGGLSLPRMHHWSHDHGGLPIPRMQHWSEGGVWSAGQGMGVWSGAGGVWSSGEAVDSHPEMATAAVSTHPTGMHSCLFVEIQKNFRQ